MTDQPLFGTMMPDPPRTVALPVVSAELDPGLAPSTVELVSCPDCGLMSTVDLGRRNSADFCRNCDFPLFWAKSTVITADSSAAGASLRRLPGTAGQANRASVACPTCGEPNQPTAVTCLRCGGPMVLPEPVAPPPEPEPVPVFVEPEPEPEPRNWWPIIIAALCLLAIVGLIVWNLLL